MYRPGHLYKLLSTPLAKRTGARPDVSTTDTLETATTPRLTPLAEDLPCERRVRGITAVPRATSTGTSQLDTGRPTPLFLQVENLLQPNVTNVLFHEGSRFWISKLRNHNIALHLHNFIT